MIATQIGRVGAAAFFLLPLWADTFDRGWSNLGRIARDRPYTIQYRSGACISGKLAGAGPGAVSLEIDATRVQAIPRTNVARVIEFPWANSHDIVFSARSSWADVIAAKPGSPEYLEVATVQGKKFRIRAPTVSTDGIGTGGRIIRKSEIQSVSYLRITPLTRDEMYFTHEQVGFLAPRTWFRYSLMPKIAVLLYDSSLPEDNSTLACP